MQINVYEMIEDDKFFIGSYPDNFSKGRWFTVEELIYSSYEKIEDEYLDKYNPNGQPELELGVFDDSLISQLTLKNLELIKFFLIFFNRQKNKKKQENNFSFQIPITFLLNP